MYGLFRAVGCASIRLGGRMRTVHARTLGDWAAIEAEIVRLRGNPYDRLRWILSVGGSEEACRELHSRLRRGWWDVTHREANTWLRTWEGRFFGLALALSDDHARVRWLLLRDFDDAARRGVSSEEVWLPIQNALDLANCDDETSALEWMEEAAKKGKKQGGHNWARIYRDLGDEPYHFPPDVVSRMTIRQLGFYFRERDKVGKRGGEVDSHEAALLRLKQADAASKKAVDNLKQGFHWGQHE